MAFYFFNQLGLITDVMRPLRLGEFSFSEEELKYAFGGNFESPHLSRLSSVSHSYVGRPFW